ncbi:heavy metal translocating P-type ATPase [Nocardia sp. NBC_01009]|uniref:heavy metal translocating P-type ATPase n=1 Tax=Nocardia sp. NBC_01009 TaxID=2975996 RepID=UPI00386489FF|nr:heavy metal translocating P-type ATPase [Nocardia sp. NBC_01009]
MATPADQRSIELEIGGMTCASCAARIEKRLGKIEGVTATVNFATEKAKVSYPQSVSPEQLVEQVHGAGYTAHVPAPPTAETDRSDERSTALDRLRQRLLISTGLALPVVAMAMIPALQFDNWQWLSLALAGPVVFWGGADFHRAALSNARHGAATMDTLISVGTLAAFGWSVYALFFGHAGMPGMKHSFSLGIERADAASNVYFEVAAGVIVFILAGRYLETRAKDRAGSALRALLELGAKDVSVLRGGVQIRVPVAELRVDELFLVRPGEKVATDGVVVEGNSALDLSLLTGESLPVDVGQGDVVIGATVNAGGLLTVRATRIGADTQLAQMVALVEEAQNSKAPVQRLADRVASIFVPIVFVISALTLAVWLVTGASTAVACGAAVAVLIIACPCALGLATPTALLVGTGRGAQLGILIKGPQVLESTRRIDTVVLDKTGTVTTGRMTLADIVTTNGTDAGGMITSGDEIPPAGDPLAGRGVSADELLTIAAAVEYGSEHPVAQAVVAAAAERRLAVPPVQQFSNHGGKGVQGVVDGRAVIVGRSALLEEWSIALPTPLAAAKAAAESAGHTAIAVAWDGAARGVLVVADAIKPTSAEAITELRRLGMAPVLLTGDNFAAARTVADRVGIDEVIAEVLPIEKLETIRRLQNSGRVVAMVGDGVNDAAALTAADLGLAMGTGTDLAIEAGDITLVRGDLRTVGAAIRLSRATLRTIKGNLFWAFGYNVAAIPLAAAGLLNPMLAGAAMALSSVFVVSNSLRLRSFR